MMDDKLVPDWEFSLLWPFPDENNGRNSILLDEDENIIKDLSIEDLARALSFSSRYSFDVEQLSSLLTNNTDTIKYRQDIIDDLAATPAIPEIFTEIIPKLDDITGFSASGRKDTAFLQHVVWRLGELDLYVDCMLKIKNVLDSSIGSIKSEGLKKLCISVNAICGAEAFKSVSTEIPKMREGFRGLSSVTLGINLDINLKPCEVTLMSINDKPFQGKSSLLNRLFSGSAGASYTGVSPLTRVNNLAKPGDRPVYDAMQIYLFNQLDTIIGSVAKPIEAVIEKFTSINSGFLTALKSDFIFYTGAVKLINTLKKAKLQMCKPKLSSMEERLFFVKDIYNMNLALNMLSKNPGLDLDSIIVTNDIGFGAEGRIMILTGPNRGGKTTYVQAIGIAQLLLQLGLFIPGSEASISPVDRIFTHFPVEEKPDSTLGRLGEESIRLGTIFLKATRYSLVLLNESLCSTSFGEGMYISREIIAALSILGVRAVFATHFHDLAENLETLNEKIKGESKIISMVSGISDGDSRRTYVIKPGPPQGLSYAADIAQQYGISFNLIMKTLKERKVISADTGIVSLLSNKSL